jgi:anti-sigma factor RsiW
MAKRQTSSEEITEETLAAYRDGELDEVRRTQVEAYLAANPQAAQFVDDSGRLTSALHCLFDRRLDEPLPSSHAELGKELERHLQRNQRAPRVRRVALAAASVALVLAAGGLGWQQLSNDNANERLFAFFQNSRLGAVQSAGEQEPATTEQATTVSQNKMVGESASSQTESGTDQNKTGAPDFSQFGFALIGTRLLAQGDSGSMQLVYESKQGARVELFFDSSGGDAGRSLTLMEKGPISLMFWNNQGRAYSLIGEVGRDTLLKLGKVVNGEWTVDISGNDGKGALQENGGDVAGSKGNGQQSTSSDGASGQEPAATDGTVTPEEANGSGSDSQKET